MRKDQEQVKEFMQKFGQPAPDKFTELSPERRLLRAKLILEEALETIAALGVTGCDHNGDLSGISLAVSGEPNWPEVIDGLCDLKYVTNGCAVELGIDLEPFEEEVHASNMEKTGGATREDGKILKPEGWRPPEIAAMLDLLQSGWRRHAREDEFILQRSDGSTLTIWRHFAATARSAWTAGLDFEPLASSEARSRTLSEVREYVRREFGV